MFIIMNMSPPPRAPPPPQTNSPRRTAPPHRTTVRDIVLVCAADAIISVSYGATSVAGGLPPWVPILMSLIVFSGGAQIATTSIVLAGGNPFAGVAAGVLLNTR